VIALAGAAAAGKLDNEFLSSRGIRVTKPEHMRPAFPSALASAPVSMSFKNDQSETASFERDYSGRNKSPSSSRMRGPRRFVGTSSASHYVTLTS
jgi:hypothetical protein